MRGQVLHPGEEMGPPQLIAMFHVREVALQEQQEIEGGVAIILDGAGLQDGSQCVDRLIHTPAERSVPLHG